jgi:hypothetical protein
MTSSPQRRRARRSRGTVVLAVAASGCFAACEPSPQATLSVQVIEGTDMDTSNVQGFRIELRPVAADSVDEFRVFTAQPGQQYEVQFEVPGDDIVDVVLFACEERAACQPSRAAFVGCARARPSTSEEPQVVFVPLFPLPGIDDEPPPGCEGLTLF